MRLKRYPDFVHHKEYAPNPDLPWNNILQYTGGRCGLYVYFVELLVFHKPNPNSDFTEPSIMLVLYLLFLLRKFFSLLALWEGKECRKKNAVVVDEALD